MTPGQGVTPEAGRLWRCTRRGESHRTLFIVAIDDFRVHVRRNTSRRTQSLNLQTLHKDYRYDRDVID